MEKIALADLKMWANELNREPWLSCKKEIARLEKEKKEIKAKWGGRGEVIINNKSFK